MYYCFIIFSVVIVLFFFLISLLYTSGLHDGRQKKEKGQNLAPVRGTVKKIVVVLDAAHQSRTTTFGQKTTTFCFCFHPTQKPRIVKNTTKTF